jgi:hypothetical protein
MNVRAIKDKNQTHFKVAIQLLPGLNSRLSIPKVLTCEHGEQYLTPSAIERALEMRINECDATSRIEHSWCGLSRAAVVERPLEHVVVRSSGG